MSLGFFKLTVGELQHLVDDPWLVLSDPHVLQDLDHHLENPSEPQDLLLEVKHGRKKKTFQVLQKLKIKALTLFGIWGFKEDLSLYLFFIY